MFNLCNIRIANRIISVAFRYAETKDRFAEFVSDLKSDDSAYLCINENDQASVPPAEWNIWLKNGGSDDSFGEFTCSTACISDKLLREGRSIIHAAAIRQRGKAWLFAGPSGIGKTTQVKNLIRIKPYEFSVICGDRPALELAENGKVFVHPSPWNGKEGLKGADAAPVAGLVLLERGKENSLLKVSNKDAVLPMLSSLIYTAEDEQNIMDVSRFIDAFLKSIPVYRLISCRVPESSLLLYNSLLRDYPYDP